MREPALAQEPTDRNSRFIEQQADCLSGVWAAGVHLRVAQFVAMRGVVSAVDDPSHRRDHGTVPQRVAAARRGIVGATPASCSLRKHH